MRTLAPILITTALLVAFSIPLLLRRVKPNGVYGVRTKATLADSAVWYEANARAARVIIVFGVASALIAVGMYMAPSSRPYVDWLVGGLLIPGMVLITLWVVRDATRIARKHAEDRRKD